MAPLLQIIDVATDIIDMSISALTSKPKSCSELVQRVQTIGKAWDEHQEWYGRNWYVQLLLAVAGLSRVVEWWEAEKQFWNFQDDKAEDIETLTFVLKPNRDTSEVSPLKQELDAGPPPISARSPLRSQPRSRDERVQKEPTPASPRRESPALVRQPSEGPVEQIQSDDASRAQVTEKIRLQAEEAQNVTIVLELSLENEDFIWINDSWFGVIGYVLCF
jgi:serine/threonine-protein kinase RIM15